MRIFWRDLRAQSAARQDDQLQVSTRGAVLTAGSADTAAQSPGDAGRLVGPGTATSPTKHRARSVEPTRALAAESPQVYWDCFIKQKSHEFYKGTQLGKEKKTFPPVGSDNVRRWPNKLPRQSTTT
eukprot:4814098-Pyramimonas_sp.AAC.1